MIKGFQILAVVLALIGAFMAWSADRDWAFIFLVLAACSYFIGMRFQIKARLPDRSTNEKPPEETENF